MNNIKFIIRRFENSEHHQFPNKIVGFEVLNENTNNTMYHETILFGDEVNNKTPEECVDIAFNKLSSSLSISATKLSGNENNILGAYYIPS